MAGKLSPISNMEDFLLSGAAKQMEFLLLSGNGSKTGKFQSSWSDNLFDFLGKILEISYITLLQDKESSSSSPSSDDNDDEDDDKDTVTKNTTTRHRNIKAKNKGAKQLAACELDEKAVAALLQIVKLRERQKLLFSLELTSSRELKRFTDSIHEIIEKDFSASDVKSKGKAKKNLKNEAKDGENKIQTSESSVLKQGHYVESSSIQQKKGVDIEGKPQFQKTEIQIDRSKETPRTADVKVQETKDATTAVKHPEKTQVKKEEEEVTPKRSSSSAMTINAYLSEAEYTPPPTPITRPVSSLSGPVLGTPITRSLLALSGPIPTPVTSTLSIPSAPVTSNITSGYTSTWEPYRQVPFEQAKEKEVTPSRTQYNSTNIFSSTNVYSLTNVYSPTNVYSSTISLSQSPTVNYAPRVTRRHSPPPTATFLTPASTPKIPSVPEKAGYTFVKEHYRQGHFVQGHMRGDTWVNGYYRQGHSVKGHYRKK